MTLKRRRSVANKAPIWTVGLAFMGSALQAAPSPTPAAEPTLEHTVVQGDTLIGLSNRLLLPGTRWTVIQRLNRIRDPHRLQPGSQLRLPLALMREQATQAVVPWVNGQVSVQRRGSTTAEPLAAGAVLLAGDLVITDAQSSAAIAFDDGTQLLLRPSSRLLIERITRVQPAGPGRTELQLEAGSADTRVPVPPAGAPRHRMQMRTPVVNLGVRGTDFRAQASAGRAQLEVLTGQVVADGGASRSAGAVVESGFGIVATGGGVGRPHALLAPPDLAGAPALVERLPIRLPWAALPGAAAYRAQVFDADGAALRLDGLFTTPQAQWSDDLPDGRYELRVRAADEQGLEGRDARTAFRLKARPEPPFITGPRDGAQASSPSVRLQWTRSAGAARYALQVADSPGFETPRLDRSDLVQPETELELPLGTHHWRVASVRGDGDRGPWSDAQVVIRTPPPPPPPSPPALSAPQTSGDGVLMAWPHAAREGARYGVQIARDVAFQTLQVDETTAQPQWLLRNPEPGVYFVRVRSIDADGLQGPFGATQQIEVPRSRLWWLLLLPAALLILL